MKKYIYTLLIAVIATACNLDFKPKSELTYNGFWEQEEGVRSAHVGLAAQFRNFVSTFYLMGEARSDIWGGITTESAQNQILIDNDFNATNTVFTNWAGFYGYIHQLNDFITNAPKAPFGNESERSNMMAQAHGMRAFIYYTMLKAWGDVIITTEPLNEEQLKDVSKLRRARSPKADVMALILKDIEKSLELYAGTNGKWKNSQVYWSKAATLMLKGDALLWKGQVLGGGDADFRAAKEALSAIEGYSLVPYKSLWGLTNEGNKEFIFTIDYQQDQAQHFYSTFTARNTDVANFVDLNGEKLEKYKFNGHNRNGVSFEVIEKLYSTPDKRQDTFILFFSQQGEYDPKNLKDEKNYRGAILAKFMGVLESDGARKYYENIPIYRYADALLLLAEAKNQLGEDPSAEINQVRQRAAKGSDFEKYVHNGDKLQGKRAILDERLKEFIGEGKRWWDLVRAGDDLVFDYVKKLDKNRKHLIYYPISRGMIAEDPEFIKQTEGYE